MVSIHDVYRFSQKENRLTALLAFALERQKALSEMFLELSGYSTKKFDSISIKLQEREEDSVPDATVYVDKKKAFFIESKLGSWIDANQIINHIKSGKGKIPVVCIIGGIAKPQGLDDASRKLSESERKLIKWISWRQLNQSIRNMPDEVVKTMEASSLIQSLESENLVGFTGYKPEEVKDLSGFVSRYNTLLSKLSPLMEDVQLSLSSKDKVIKLSKFVRDGRSLTPDVISFCDYAFAYEKWANCGYDATRDWVREEGSFAAISFYFDQEKVYSWARATYGTIEKTEPESWKDILNHFDSREFTISLLSEGARDFEDLDVERALERLKGGKVKVIDFRKEYNLRDILTQKPNRVISTLVNEILSILGFFKKNRVFTLKKQKNEHNGE